MVAMNLSDSLDKLTTAGDRDTILVQIQIEFQERLVLKLQLGLDLGLDLRLVTLLCYIL